MKKEPLQAQGLSRLQGSRIGVLWISQNGMAPRLEMNANLVGASGERLALQKRDGLLTGSAHPQQANAGGTDLALRIGPNPTLAVGRQGLEEGRLNQLAARLPPGSHHQGKVALAHPPLPQQSVQMEQRPALGGEHEQPRGLPIQPMGQLQIGVRAGGTKRLHQPQIDPTASMDGQSRRLIHHQQPIMLVDHRQLECNAIGLGLPGQNRPLRLLLWGGHPHGRNSNGLAEDQARIGLNPPPVDPHLARADHAIDPGFGDPFEDPQQKVIHTLAIPPRVNDQVLNLLKCLFQ